MPEGHTVHALAGRLDAAFAGSVPAVSSPQGRFAGGAARLDGVELLDAEAFGKHLRVRFAGDLLLHVHLGLFGRFSVRQHRRKATAGPPPQLPVTGQVRLRLVDRTHVGDLRGPITCAVLTPEEWADVEARIGADPLRTTALPASTSARLARTRRPIGAVLMDQSVIAGVGNVYRAELLHRHETDPHRPARDVPPGVLDAIWDDLVRLMPLGVRSGRILVGDDDVARAEALMAAGGTGRIRPAYAVYRRDGRACPRCGAVVVRETMAGRNLFRCPGCQV